MLIVPGDEVSGLCAVGAVWNEATGWRSFSRFPFTAEHRARLDRLADKVDNVAIQPEGVPEIQGPLVLEH